MDLDEIIRQYKDVERAGISDMDTLMTATPILAREIFKLQEKVRKFEKRYPSDGSESEYDQLKKEIKTKDKDIINIKSRQKNESVLLRKEMGKTSKMLEDLRAQSKKDKETTDKYKIALKQSDLLVESIQNEGSTEEDKKEIQRLNNELVLKKNEIIAYKNDDTIAKLNNELNILQKGLLRAELELSEFKNITGHDVGKLKRRLSEANTELTNDRNALESAKRTINDLKKRISNDYLQREIDRLKKELETMSSLKISNSVQKEQIKTFQNLVDESEADIKKREKEKSADRMLFQEKMDQAIHEISRLKKEIESSKESTKTIDTGPNEESQTLRNDLEKSKNEIDTLKNEKNADRSLFQEKMDQAILEISRLKKLNNDSNILEEENKLLKEELEKANSIISNIKKFSPPTKKQGKSGDAGWDVDYNTEKNRLTLGFNGVFTYSDAKKATRSIESVLNNVKPGFDVICDLTNLKKNFERKTSFQLKKIIFMMQTAHLKRMVRIASPEKKPFGEVLNCVSNRNVYQIFDTTSIDNIEEFLT